jgi:hypothetical protein
VASRLYPKIASLEIIASIGLTLFQVQSSFPQIVAVADLRHDHSERAKPEPAAVGIRACARGAVEDAATSSTAFMIAIALGPKRMVPEFRFIRKRVVTVSSAED